MKRIISGLLLIILLFTAISSLADTIEVKKKDQGIVNTVLYNQFKNQMEDMFDNTLYPALTVTMLAAQMESLINNFVFCFEKTKEPLAYVGLADHDNNILFIALMDTNKNFLMVSIIPKKNYMSYFDESTSKKEAVDFIKGLCTTYTEITYDQVKLSLDYIESMQP